MRRLRLHRGRSFMSATSGAVSLTFAITLTVLCGFVALAMDIGHLFMVRSELQRAADAGALAGAMGLLPYTGSLSDPTPNWLQAQTAALAAINHTANKVDGRVNEATAGNVETGYWLLKPPENYVQTLPQARPTSSAHLPVPAVRVTLSRNATLYFAPLIGISSPQLVQASATAIMPEAVQAANLPPIAVAYDTVYNLVGQNVYVDASDQVIKIQSQNDKAGWFNLNGGNSVPSVRFSEPLKAPTQQIYLVPGTKATLTDFLTQGQTIVLPVVADVNQKVWRNIIGFAAFKVVVLHANSMEGHFLDKHFDPNIMPVVSDLNGVILGGVAGTPKLVSP